ncbi:MAG TPA: NUDIX hydrolase [Streptosporangiaceae bacterium]|nr:NUDIX hydrolase [Streptosporangiaceae bacterium]
MTQTWQVHGERTLYRDDWIHLVMADVALPDGRRLEHRLVRYFDGAQAVVTDAGKILLLWRYRFIPGTWGWEIPGGAVNVGEDPATAAAREVEEETGWRPDGPMRLLFRTHPMPGLVSVRHHVFRADSAVYTGPPTDGFEAQRVAWVPFGEARCLIAQGHIVEATTLAAVLSVLGP